MSSSNIARHLKHAVKFVNKHMLPDTVRLYSEKAGVIGKNIDGSLQFGADRVYRSYNGSNVIPCSISMTRGMRFEQGLVQPIVASEFVIVFPVDFFPVQDDVVEWGTRFFRMRKEGDVGSVREVNWYTLVELTHDTAE